MLFFPFLLTFLSGLLAGFIGAQAGGGSLITLPALLTLGLPPLIAIGTNRFSAIFLALFAFMGYLKSHTFALKKVLGIGISCVFGALFGSHLVLQIAAAELRQIILMLLVALLIVTIYKKELGMTHRHLYISRRHYVILSFFSFLLGIYGGFVGIALMPFFALLFLWQGQSFTHAMGYALFLNVLVSLASSIFFIMNQTIWYDFAIAQSCGAGLGAWFGSRYALKKGDRFVRRMFIAIMIIFIGKLLFDLY